MQTNNNNNTHTHTHTHTPHTHTLTHGGTWIKISIIFLQMTSDLNIVLTLLESITKDTTGALGWQQFSANHVEHQTCQHHTTLAFINYNSLYVEKEKHTHTHQKKRHIENNLLSYNVKFTFFCLHFLNIIFCHISDFCLFVCFIIISSWIQQRIYINISLSSVDIFFMH